MNTYQYKNVMVREPGQDLVDVLNEQGLQGWELSSKETVDVGSIDRPQRVHYLLMKKISTPVSEGRGAGKKLLKD